MRSLILLVLALFAFPVFADAEPLPRTLNLNTSVDTKVAPNIAYINIGVTTQAMTAKDSVAQNAVKMKTLVDTVQKALGSTGKLETGNFQVTPTYQYDDKTRKSSLTGYETTNQVRVQTSDLKNVGALVDSAASAGSNQIQSLQFSHTEMTSLTTQATLRAIQQSQTDATQMAQAAGVHLGKVMTVTVMGNGPGPLYKSERMMMAGAMDAQTPVIPGELTVTGSVSVTYELM